MRRHLPPARRADPRAPPRVPPRARGALLGLRLPDPPRARARPRVPREGARQDPGRRRRRAARRGDRRRARRARRRSSPASTRPGAGREALRTGKISLLVEDDGGLVYRFDPTRPDARAARLEVDDALQRAAGREDPLRPREARVTEPGSRYIDFLVPGLLGLNLMGTGMWGLGFSIVNARAQEAPQAARGDPDAAERVPPLADARAPRLPRLRGRDPRRLRLARLRGRGPRLPRRPRARLAPRRGLLRRPRRSSSPRGRRRSRGSAA